MEALAKLAGTSNQQIARLEKPPGDKDHRKLTKEWAEKLAPHLGITAQELLFGGDLSTDVDKSQQWRKFEVAALKLVGYVEAGAWRDVSSGEFPEREVYLPRDQRYPIARQFCLQARGDSMNAAKPVPILDGALLRCVDLVDSGMSVRDGQIAIIERTMNGGHLIETTVKRVVVSPKGYELRPESTNPAHKPLQWTQDTERTGEVRVIAIVTAIVNELEQI